MVRNEHVNNMYMYMQLYRIHMYIPTPHSHLTYMYMYTWILFESLFSAPLHHRCSYCEDYDCNKRGDKSKEEGGHGVGKLHMHKYCQLRTQSIHVWEHRIILLIATQNYRNFKLLSWRPFPCKAFENHTPAPHSHANIHGTQKWSKIDSSLGSQT